MIQRVMPTPLPPSLGPRKDFGGPAWFRDAGDYASPYKLTRRTPPKRKKRPDEGGVPVEPNRPNTLTGGAAAALEFEGE